MSGKTEKRPVKEDSPGLPELHTKVSSTRVEWKDSGHSSVLTVISTEEPGSLIEKMGLVRNVIVMVTCMKDGGGATCKMVKEDMCGKTGMSMLVSGRTVLFGVKGF